MLPSIICVGLSGLCSLRQELRIHFCGGEINREDSSVANERVILRMMARRVTLKA
jgi:hypothetical protein